MARSCRLTCLKIEGNSFLNKVPRPTCDFFLTIIWNSDRPKSCWGYYQDYLVHDFWKKIPKKFTSIFDQKSQISQGYSMAKKFDELATAGDVEILE